jgi:hypothetical protein
VRVIEANEPIPDARFAGIVSGPKESTNEAPGGPWKAL